MMRFQRAEDIGIFKEVLFIICKANINAWNVANLVFCDYSKDYLFLYWKELAFAVPGSARFFRTLNLQFFSAKRNASLDITVNHGLISSNLFKIIRCQ